MLVTIPRPRMTQQGQRFDGFRLFVNQFRQVARHIDAAVPREGTQAKLVQDPHPTVSEACSSPIPRPRMTQQGQRFEGVRLFVYQLRQVARHIDAAVTPEGTKRKLV